MDIAVAVSGGIDSLASILTLKAAGHRVIALHARLHDHNARAQADTLTALQSLLASYKIPLHVFDLRRAFHRAVILPSLMAWNRGLTPNPCALCNRAIKFGLLFHNAQKLHSDFFATGHYARISTVQTQSLLTTPADLKKNQTYFLSLLRPEILSALLFPLAQKTKEEIRQELASLPIPNAKESQDVCFLPACGSQRDAFFLQKWQEEHLPLPKPGPILLLKDSGYTEKVGTHEGLWRYTEGQRRGLKISASEGLYVLKKEPDMNSLLIGTKRHLGILSLQARLVSFFTQIPHKAFVKIRYRQKAIPATVEHKGKMLKATFSSPQMPSAPGQILSVQTEDGTILAGGIIQSQTYCHQ